MSVILDCHTGYGRKLERLQKNSWRTILERESTGISVPTVSRTRSPFPNSRYERVPPILDAVRAFRRVLLPRAQAAVEGIVAAAEVLGLRSPSSGRHQSVKSWGCGGKVPVRFPLKSRNSHLSGKRSRELTVEVEAHPAN